MTKKLLILATVVLALLVPLTAAATAPGGSDNPSAATETFYIQLVSEPRPGATSQKSVATIEIGNEFVNLTGISTVYAATIRKMRFPSLLDGLNHLAVTGWKLVDTATITAGARQTIVWTLAKTITDRAELLDGLGSASANQ